MFFSKILSVLTWLLGIRVIVSNNVESRVSDLNWKTILKIKNTDLAYVLQLGASLTDFSLLVSSSPARSPLKHRERLCTNLAFLVKIR